MTTTGVHNGPSSTSQGGKRGGISGGNRPSLSSPAQMSSGPASGGGNGASSHAHTSICREFNKYSRHRRVLQRTMEEAQVTFRDLHGFSLFESDLNEIYKEVSKNAAFIIFGQSFSTKARVANIILQDDVFSIANLSDEETQRTVRFSFGKRPSCSIAVVGDNNEDFDFIEHEQLTRKPPVNDFEWLSMADLQISGKNRENVAICTKTLDVKVPTDIFRDGTVMYVSTSNNKFFNSQRVLLQCMGEFFPIAIYALHSSKLNEVDIKAIEELRQIIPDLPFLFLHLGFEETQDFTESAEEAYYETIKLQLVQMGILHPPEDFKIEQDSNPESERDYSSRQRARTKSDLAHLPMEVDLSFATRGDSLRATPRRYLDPLANVPIRSEFVGGFLNVYSLLQFLQVFLRCRTIRNAARANSLLTEGLEKCISSSYQISTESKLTPVRLNWAKQKEQALFDKLVEIADRNHTEIRNIISDSIQSRKDELIEEAVNYEFTDPSLSNTDHAIFPGNVSSKVHRFCQSELEHLILKSLNTIIADKLTASVDCLHQSFVDTLKRTVHSLEENEGGGTLDTMTASMSSISASSAQHALADILNAAYQIEISSKNASSLYSILFEKLRQIVSSLGILTNGSIDEEWKRHTAQGMIEKISEDKLARGICSQFRDKLEKAHADFALSLRQIEESQMQRLGKNEEQGKQLRKYHSPKMARYVLESICLRDLAVYGMPRCGPEIGRGQYGVVYSCTKWGTFAPCAVKSVAPPDEKHWNNLAMEFYYTKSLPEHSRIVQIRGSVIDHSYAGGQGAVLLIMDRVKRDLHTAIKQSLPLIQRLQVAVDVVEGLRFLHKEGLVHRDIKLKNVLLDMEHRGKITDLGFCKPEAMMSGSVVGTPIHMAPELFKGAYNSSVDTYAFGILFWYICAGTVRLPQNFEQCSSKENLWSAVQKGCRPERLGNFTEEMWSLMTQCWASKPQNRPHLGDVESQLVEIRAKSAISQMGGEVQKKMSYTSGGGDDTQQRRSAYK